MIAGIVAGYPVSSGPPPAGTTWDPANKGANVVLSGGDLIANVVVNNQMALVTNGKSSGKLYFELLVGSMTADYGRVGVEDITANPNGAITSFAYRSNGALAGGSPGLPWTNGDVLGFTIDFTVMPNPLVTAYVNNVLSTSKDVLGGVTYSPAVDQNYGSGYSFPFTLRPDAASQTYSPPAGFSPWD